MNSIFVTKHSQYSKSSKMERWRNFHPKQKYENENDNKFQDDGAHHNSELKNGIKFFEETNSSHSNVDDIAFCELSCRPKYNGYSSKMTHEFDNNDKMLQPFHICNCCGNNTCHDCYDPQYTVFSDIDSKSFCNSLPKLCCEKAHEVISNCNIDSSLCQTVVCDGMESYFEENSSQLKNMHSDKLLNDESTMKSSEQNNLNFEACLNEVLNKGKQSYNVNNLPNGTNPCNSLNTSSENNFLNSPEKYDGINKDLKMSLSNDNNACLVKNLMCNSYENGEVAIVEMDCIDIDLAMNVHADVEENINVDEDSDLGTESRGSSPQPSSYDSGNDNEEVNGDILSDANTYNEEISNDHENNLQEVENVESCSPQKLRFKNQLSPNIVSKSSCKADSAAQNVFTNDHFQSNDPVHVNMEICETKINKKETLFNIHADDMECEDLNFHSKLLKIEKVTVKNNIFSSKTNHDSQPLPKYSKEMDIGLCKENVMIWSEKEACSIQVSQVSTLACGTTAVINALLALKIPFSEEAVLKAVTTRLRKESAPLAEYLLSRSCAGATHNDLIAAVDQVTNGKVFGRFFHLYPAKQIQLMQWVADFIKLGAIPIATLNLQKGVSPGDTIPDSWHHQMIFGVGPNGMYMTNPLTCVPSSVVSKQLCSESTLLIKRGDIIDRWGENGSDLMPILTNPDPNWTAINVIGQIVNIMREAAAAPSISHRRTITHHVSIPAAYQSGITFFMHRDSKYFHQFYHYPELS